VSAAARRARLDRAVGTTPRIAVVGDVPAAPLRRAGWQLRGSIERAPYADPLDVRGYADVADLLDDPLLDAVAVDGEDPGLAALLPELRRQGLLLLLPTAAPLDPEPLWTARAVPDPPATAVGLLRRWEPWAQAVSDALPLAGGPVLQVTVRRWPRGRQAAAELVDLAVAWCGEVAAVVAAPAALPAAALPGGEPVAWALLCAAGATVLVSHEGPAERVRLSFPAARLDAGPHRVRWEGGAELPLPTQPSSGADDGFLGAVATAAALAGATGGRDLPRDRSPHAADLGDLFVVSRVLEALRSSARTGQPVRVA
jgi:hypothetical protein